MNLFANNHNNNWKATLASTLVFRQANLKRKKHWRCLRTKSAKEITAITQIRRSNRKITISLPQKMISKQKLWREFQYRYLCFSFIASYFMRLLLSVRCINDKLIRKHLREWDREWDLLAVCSSWACSSKIASSGQLKTHFAISVSLHNSNATSTKIQ